MRKVTTTIIVLVSWLLCFNANAQRDTLRILAIGNSFSEDAVEQNLHEIATADGRAIIIGSACIGGCSLERHYNNSVADKPAYRYRKIGLDGKTLEQGGATLDHALKDEPWDIVSLQQVSGKSGQPWTFEPYLPDLIKYVKARVPKDVRLMWHQTWAYDDNAVHGDFPKYGSSCARMYQAIIESSKWVTEKYKLDVIPSGTAVQNSRNTWNADNVTRDGYHMNLSFGRYLVACTWYEAISGASVLGNSYHPSTLGNQRAELAQRCAHAANAKPWAVSDAGIPEPKVNYDESRIPAYTLPDALVTSAGQKVRNAKTWESARRPEILEMFASEMFGKAPGRPENLRFEVFDTDSTALGGIAIRKQIRIYYTKDRYLTALLYTPKFAEGPVPVFAGVNFRGNAAVHADPGIALPESGQISRYGRHQDVPRASQQSRWPLEMIISRGYGVATYHTYDVDPDWDDSFRNGVHPHFYAKGQTYPKPDEWGSIAAWAWGLSRVLDYLETDADVDAKKVAAIGHSRLGKTALWAGASDPRFAMVVSNDSGCGGAALSRRCIGETVGRIQRRFPHWFCENFKKYMDDESALPFDQHELLALVAPRPLYVASASEDLWADPKGEFLSLKEASKVYGLYKLPTLEKYDMPAVSSPLSVGRLGYHLRQGKHAISAYDWMQYLNFADKNLK